MGKHGVRRVELRGVGECIVRQTQPMATRGSEGERRTSSAGRQQHRRKRYWLVSVGWWRR